MKTKKSKKQGPNAQLSSYLRFSSPSDKGRFTRIIQALHLSNSQKHEIEHFYKQANAPGLDTAAAESFVSQFDAIMVDVNPFLDHKIQKKVTELKKLQAHQDVKGKFQTTLPFLSFVFCCNMPKELKDALLPLWLDLENGHLLLDENGQTKDRGWDDFETVTVPTARHRVKKVTIYQMPNGTVEFTSGAAICVDGAPQAYGPNDSGSDTLTSAGIPKENYWWGVVTENWKAETSKARSTGNPLIKADGYYISTTAYVYSLQPDNVQARYVNANNVPFSVMSIESMEKLKEFGLKIEMGDLVYTYNSKTKKGKWTAFLETRLKDDRIGEVSLAAAYALGIGRIDPITGEQKINPRKDGQEEGVTFIFYPNTSPLQRAKDDPSHFLNDAEAKEYIDRNGKNIDAGRPVDRLLPKRS